MEFGRKTMKLLRGPIYWPISNQKVAPIYAKLNFGTQKKAPKQKHLKNAISKGETIEFGWKTMILQGSPSHWPISDRKVALICLKQNSGAKKKQPPKWIFFLKNVVSQGETMEFGRKTMNLLRGPICWPISNLKVAPI